MVATGFIEVGRRRCRCRGLCSRADRRRRCRARGRHRGCRLRSYPRPLGWLGIGIEAVVYAVVVRIRAFGDGAVEAVGYAVGVLSVSVLRISSSSGRPSLSLSRSL